MKIISIAFAAVLLLSAGVYAAETTIVRPQGIRKAAAASSPSSSRRRGLKKDDVGRDCELIQSEDEIEFECKSKTTDVSGSDTKDEIDFKIKNKDARGLVVKVKYEQEVETADMEGAEQETETETSYEVVFDRIVEYTKNASRTSTDDAYDWENDTVLQTLSLSSFGTFSPVADTNTSSVFSVGSNDGLVTFTFTIHRATEGESVNANRMKIDFLLENFPWIESNSFVALVSAVESKRKVEVEYDDRKKKEKPEDVIIDFAEAVTGINGFVPFGSYTWETVAAVVANSTEAALESTPIRVVATSPKQSVPSESDGESVTQWVAFSFVGPNAKSASSIYWDPEAGIGYRRVGNHSLIIGLTLGAVLLVVVTLFLWFVVYYKGCKKVKSLFRLNGK